MIRGFYIYSVEEQIYYFQTSKIIDNREKKQLFNLIREELDIKPKDQQQFQIKPQGFQGIFLITQSTEKKHYFIIHFYEAKLQKEIESLNKKLIEYLERETSNLSIPSSKISRNIYDTVNGMLNVDKFEQTANLDMAAQQQFQQIQQEEKEEPIIHQPEFQAPGQNSKEDSRSSGSRQPTQLRKSENSLDQNIMKQYLRIFRAFMMFDYSRQFFYMFIRRGFEVDKSWNVERVKIQSKIMEVIKQPPDLLEFSCDFGLVRGMYDKKTKCYFILLSRFKTDDQKQDDLLKEIQNSIQQVPKYAKTRFDVLEKSKKEEIRNILIKHEKMYESEFGYQVYNVEKFERIVDKLLNQGEKQKNVQQQQQQQYQQTSG